MWVDHRNQYDFIGTIHVTKTWACVSEIGISYKDDSSLIKFCKYFNTQKNPIEVNGTTHMREVKYILNVLSHQDLSLNLKKGK